MPASTVHAVLVRCRINRLSHIDRVTGEPIRRYEHPHPGSLIHVDSTKFGNFPDGGGWRYVGKQQGDANRRVTRDRTGVKARKYHPKVGTAFVHTVIDGRSRVAYAEIRDDENADTAVDVLRNDLAWFAQRGVTVESVLSDNGSCFRSFAWRRTHQPRRRSQTHPPLPPANQRQDRALPPHPGRRLGLGPPLRLRSLPPRALLAWLHFYDFYRAHSAIGALQPIGRLNNLPEHHT
jgi:transposase InsO family protein